MGSIIYRELQFHEAELLRHIDRSERIDGMYRAMNGSLQLEETRQTVSSWNAAESTAYIARVQALLASGGKVFAAWDERRLVGIGSLDASGVGGDSTILTLDMLYVSAEYRRQGIGRRLTEMVASQARSLGAADFHLENAGISVGRGRFSDETSTVVGH